MRYSPGNIMLCLLGTALAFNCLHLPAADGQSLIPSSFFRDDDSDGKIDGWEAKTFFLEKDKQNPSVKRLTLKIQQEKDYQITGEVTTVFQGKTAGYYQITVRYLDENDGISTAKLLVNGKVVHIWDFDNIFVSYVRNEVINNVYLSPGDKITINCANDFTEYCRLISVNVVPSPKPPTPQEIEDMKPPAVADLSFGNLVPLCKHRDLSSESLKSECQFKGTGDIVFNAKAGEKIKIQLSPGNSRSNSIDDAAIFSLGTSSTGLETGTAVEAELKFPLDPETKSGVAFFTAPADGLYRLNIRNAMPVLDVPHVFPCSSKTRSSLASNEGYYFFVPKGTKAFALKSLVAADRTSEVILLTPKGTLCKRTCIDGKEELAVRVPEGMDDGIWFVLLKGIAPRLVLRGIPSFVASHPKYLLVPQESVADKN